MGDMVTQEGEVANDRIDGANVKFVHKPIPLFPDYDSEVFHTSPRPHEDHDAPINEEAIKETTCQNIGTAVTLETTPMPPQAGSVQAETSNTSDGATADVEALQKRGWGKSTSKKSR